MTSSAMAPPGEGRSTAGPSTTEVGAAAALGGLGGMLLLGTSYRQLLDTVVHLGPFGMVAGAAGAAYCTTRNDAVGYAARGAGSCTAATVHQVGVHISAMLLYLSLCGGRVRK